jgi:hypothetical protein
MSTAEVQSFQEKTLPERRYPMANFLIYFKWYLIQLALTVLVAAYALLETQTHPQSNLWVLGIISGGAGVGLVFYLAYRQIQRVRWVAVSEQVLSWEDRLGVHECALNEIRDVYRSETVSTFNDMWAHHQLKVTLTMTKGRTLKLDMGIAGISELCDLIQSISADNRPSGADGVIDDRGETFGPLTVFQDGLLMKGRKYPWADIRSYEIEEGYVTIHPYMKKGCQKGVFLLSKIPNYPHFLELMETMSGRRLLETK